MGFRKPLVTVEPPESPLQPLYEIGVLVEEARQKLRDAAKIADAEGLPEAKIRLMCAMESAEAVESFLADWAQPEGAR